MIFHNIPPLYNANSKILILGSFPSVKSREARFFYGHKQNRFWKLVAKIFGSQTPETIEQKREFILQNHLALWDVVESCEISGSSDSSIKNVVANDISIIINNSKVCKIFLNGKTAAKLYEKYLKNKIDLPYYVLPSTSPANAACNFEDLCNAWKIIKE